MKSSNTAAYLPRLDHLRFFAAFLVAIYHYHVGLSDFDNAFKPIRQIVSEGEMGVTLFMVLSGFILAKISMNKNIDYKTFLYNRFLRIYPLYVTVIIISAFSGTKDAGFIQVLSLLSPFANLGRAAPENFPHMWTIPVEFQFYLVFPFLMFFYARYGMRYLLGIVLFSILVRVFLYLMNGTVQMSAYWTILGRIDEFTIGIIAAALISRFKGVMSSSVTFLVSGLFIYVWITIFKAWTGGGYYGKEAASSMAWIFAPTLEAFVWAMFAVSYIQQKWWMPASLDKVLSYLGTISFSMYVWHYPIITLFKRYPPSIGVWYLDFILIVFPVILVCASLSYYIIEKPFISMRQVYTDKSDAVTGSHPI